MLISRARLSDLRRWVGLVTIGYGQSKLDTVIIEHVIALLVA